MKETYVYEYEVEAIKMATAFNCVDEVLSRLNISFDAAEIIILPNPVLVPIEVINEWSGEEIDSLYEQDYDDYHMYEEYRIYMNARMHGMA